MPRKVRVRLLDGGVTYGDGAERLPAGTEMVFTEAEAAAVLKDRRNRDSVEVIEILDGSDDDAGAESGSAPSGHPDEQSPAS